MRKAMLILDEMPDSCRDCPFHKKVSAISLGNYTYEQLYSCQVIPEEVWRDNDEDDEEVDIYINEHMINRTKPEWCPLKEVQE